MLNEVLLALVLLQIKHWYIDFVNQSNEEVAHKGIYMDWLGIKHSLKQGIATALIFWIWVHPVIAIMLGIIDFAVHYHIDWAKMNINKKMGYTIEMSQFWALLGADQLAHQLTYLGLIWLVV
jgi:hypothetical protein